MDHPPDPALTPAAAPMHWLYSGQDAKGRSIQGFVQAHTAQEALALIVRQQPKLRHVQLHSTAGHGDPVADLAQLCYGQPPDQLSNRQMRHLARMLIQAQQDPGSHWHPLKHLLRNNALELLLSAGVMGWGLWSGALWASLIGALLLATPFALHFFLRRYEHWYRQGLHAAAHGHQAQLAMLEQRLTRAAQRPWAPRGLAQAAWDLALRQAWFSARTEGLRGVMDTLRAHPCAPQDEGEIALRTYYLHFAKGDHDYALMTLQALLSQTPEHPALLMDSALAHALKGQASQARALLARISPQTLPPFASLYFDWVQGLIALTEQKPALAVGFLTRASQQALRRLPAQAPLWAPLAACTTDLALALHLNGQQSEAQKTLADIWPLARHNVSPARLRMIRNTILGTPHRHSIPPEPANSTA